MTLSTKMTHWPETAYNKYVCLLGRPYIHVGYIQIIMLMLVAMSDTYVIKVYDLIGC